MNTFQVNDPAPQFELYNFGHKIVRLADFMGKYVVLYFYPKDDTPGCTKEACDFRDASSEFADLNAVIVGVSKDTEHSHDGFVQKYGLPFILLSDPDAKVQKQYGAWQEKGLLARLGLGTQRTTFLIDPQARIRKIYKNVDVTGHVKLVLADLKQASLAR